MLANIILVILFLIIIIVFCLFICYIRWCYIEEEDEETLSINF